METNIQKDKAATKKVPATTKLIESDPFAEKVEVPVAKKSTAAKIQPAAARAKVEALPVKKVIRKSTRVIAADPFAKTVKMSSPVKKQPVKTAKAAKRASKKGTKKSTADVISQPALTKPEIERSPVFKALADVSLPELRPENRARLQMQTPTRLYFYWSIKENPWAMLRDVFGDDLTSYALVVKLIDKKNDREEVNQCDAAGNWWFDVEPDHTYEAEIGFYAPNRPYFRILHSNTVETPRRSPSLNKATQSDWTVSADKFAEVLDVAGFSHDAFDVAMAGDDYKLAEYNSQVAFSSFMGKSDFAYDGILGEDIRYAMLAIASGVTPAELRFKISPVLFAILQANAERAESGRAMSSLTKYFDIDETEFTEEQIGPAVYGASLVNFPRTLKTRNVSLMQTPRYNPVSSHSHQY